MKAVIGSYRDYLSTGLVSWNPKKPSPKAKDVLKLLGLENLIPKEK